MWTLDELVDRVRDALAAEYPGAPNNRVRDLPDRRAVRWYTTVGLVDRPLGTRGRAALYGPRHLLQLVALKRRQAGGHTLAAIQAELAGASDATLAGVARIPAESLAGHGPVPDADGPGRARFWAAPTPTAAPTPAAVLDDPAAPPPASAAGAVALGQGAILVLPALPSRADRAEIAAAARPLMALLAERGLLHTEDRSTS